MVRKRGTLLLVLIFFLLMFCIPFLSMGRQMPGKENSTAPPGKTASSSASQAAPTAAGGEFKILDSKSGQSITVDDRSFLYGAVAAEMSPEAEPEALKAQAIASYTYYGRLRQMHRQKPDAELKGADFSGDLQDGMVYVSRELMQKRWGTSFNSHYKNLTTAVDAVYGQVLKSGGSLIDATYFAISSGNTESSKDVWGSSYPYLVSVASPGDVFSGGYQTSVTVSSDQLKSAILSIAPKASLSSDASGWIGSTSRTPSGLVKTISVGGENLTGSQIRSAFNLRSSNFTITYANGNFTFSVKGYGHGVGMSQTGAQYMARQGANYQQILSWYYPTTQLTKL